MKDGSEQDRTRHAWAEPGVQTVARGIHRIPLPLPMDGLRAVNVYVIEDGDGLVLIDGGWAIEASRVLLESSLTELGYELADVRRVLVTHVHRDHYTQAVAIRRAVGAEVSLGSGEQTSIRELIEGRTRREEPASREERARREGRGDPGRVAETEVDPDRDASRLVLLRRLGADELADELAAMTVNDAETLAFYEEPDVWLEPGRIDLATLALEAVHTPGHTRGHLVFHAPERELLFAGDHVLPAITPSIGFEPDRPPFPLRDYLGSLRRILEMPDATLLPAHGPAGGSTHARAHALIAHHEQRLADTLAALVAGEGSAPDVARILRWTSRGRRYEELGLFDRMLAMLETAAHLDVLVLRGEATRDESGDRIAYEVASGRSPRGSLVDPGAGRP